MNQYFKNAKMQHPELSIEIDEIIGQTMSQCEIENHPNDSELWDAEQYLNELIERNPKYNHEAPMPETWYEQNL
jgi:hypothetical protein